MPVQQGQVTMEMSTRATMKEMSRVLTMETVRESRDEEELSKDLSKEADQGRGEMSSIMTRRTSPTRMRFMGRWCNHNPLRCWWLQLLGILCAATMVIVVGVMVYRNSLDNKRQEILLKCDNRKEVSPHFP